MTMYDLTESEISDIVEQGSIGSVLLSHRLNGEITASYLGGGLEKKLTDDNVLSGSHVGQCDSIGLSGTRFSWCEHTSF